MGNVVTIFITVIAGFLLGVFFFGTLWWTTKKGILSNSPALWFLGSLILRMAITITVFYFISRDHWDRALICLVGFVIARGIIMRSTKVGELNET